MSRKSEPWYIHAILGVVILGLTYLLIQVAIIEPRETVKLQNYYKQESRLRMMNLREAQILFKGEYGHFTDDLDSLINFVKTDSAVAAKITGIDSITGKSSNPFDNLTSGKFIVDSLYKSPRSFQMFVLEVDTNIVVDTVINRRGNIVKIDSTFIRGTRYLIQSPDSKDRIGDKDNDALLNTASWE